ncbi:MAG: hypothetical protein HOC23_04160 [Halieaceae bacterium]|nr:hypothetical protein [Halieaceae bacterium]
MIRLLKLIALLASTVLCASAISAQQGAASSPITEYNLPASLSAPYAIEADQGGRIWFTEKIGRHLAVFDPSDARFEVYALPESWGKVGPAQLAIAGSGDVWFTIRRWAEDVTQTNVVGRFTPSTGSYVRYEISLGASPQEIVADDQNRLWLLASDRNQLFRVDPIEGRVTSYEIPTADSNPQGLTIGQNGDVWFSEPNVNKIARYGAETGFFQEFEIPTAFSNPGDIALDSHGKVWFVERTSNRLGVLYPELNRFDEALIPTVNALPHAIEVDGSDRLWFLEYRGNKVGVFDPTQAIFQEFDIPSYNSQPGELVFEPVTQQLWFTESNAESSKLGTLPVTLAGLAADAGSTATGRGLIETMGEGTLLERGTGSGTPALYIGLAVIVILLGGGLWFSNKSGEVS